jgi:MFS family permease
MTPSLLPRMIVGSWVLVTINTLIFGFVTWLPQFFLQQGLTITRSFACTLVIVLGTPFGALCGALCADSIGRRRTIIGASVLTIAFGVAYASFTAATAPWLILTVGFLLIVAIYIQVAMLFGVYIPELFPTDVRLRANGICHTFGRAAGGKLESWYFDYGDSTAYGFVDYPDEIAAATAQASVNAGGFARVTYRPVLSAEDADRALARSAATRPPQQQ